MSIFIELFLAFCQVGAFSFGGGMAAMPLIQNQIVDVYGWMTLTDFANIVTIAEMTPGPIALNAASFVGNQVAGVFGAVAATLGCVTPSCIIVLTLAYFYYKYRDLSVIQGVLGGLRPAVVALIASAGMTLLGLALFEGSGKTFFTAGLSDVSWIAVGLFVACLAVLRLKKPNPILVMISAGVVGLFVYQLA